MKSHRDNGTGSLNGLIWLQSLGVKHRKTAPKDIQDGPQTTGSNCHVSKRYRIASSASLLARFCALRRAGCEQSLYTLATMQ